MNVGSEEEKIKEAEDTGRQIITNKIQHGRSCSLPALSVGCGARRGGYVPVHKVRSTVRLRFRKNIFGHHFQTIRKLAKNDF